MFNRKKVLQLYIKHIQNVIKNVDIMAETRISQYFINSDSEDYLIFISLLKDKCYQIFMEHKENLLIRYQVMSIEKAKIIAQLYESNVTAEIFSKELLKRVFKFTKDLSRFAKILPGLDVLDDEDFASIIKSEIYVLFLMINSKYFVDEDCFIILDNNLQLSRKWLNKFKGKKAIDLMFIFISLFKNLNLSDDEQALFLPLLLFSPGKNK